MDCDTHHIWARELSRILGIEATHTDRLWVLAGELCSIWARELAINSLAPVNETHRAGRRHMAWCWIYRGPARRLAKLALSVLSFLVSLLSSLLFSPFSLCFFSLLLLLFLFYPPSPSPSPSLSSFLFPLSSFLFFPPSSFPFSLFATKRNHKQNVMKLTQVWMPADLTCTVFLSQRVDKMTSEHTC